ncbi:AraC family transcriptional regulator [Arhodomonas aquaeolei]|uniref:AraC family transcriptional regulator n=1 Tax=Arhodomonas aquaeolei TaxID=2369 RepID=UPI000365E726|nr:AraC family transcriptional regulator [Arhodomonas aquaeolei]MCS4505880.1 AraC family transcriptional regulator [Arhodomonas aquaeolei]
MTQSTSDRDWFVHSQNARIERLEAYFGGHAYEPHRHDTYAIGMTLSGVQSFHYRGEHRHSVPGRTIVLHPDELHDGHAGSEGGFRYRMIYIPPAIIQDMLGGRALPYIPGGITRDRRLGACVARLLRHVDNPPEDFEEDDGLFDLAMALSAHAGQRPDRHGFDYPAAQRAREFLDAAQGRAVTLAELEAASGRDRWRLSRDFRTLFGTSPYRYLTMRRLERVKQRLRSGAALSDAAIEAGFADQSHMTRQFSEAYGISPGRWRRLIEGNAGHTAPTGG